LILSRLGIDDSLCDVAELCCGYGTFSIQISRAISETLFTFNIDTAMVERTKDGLMGCTSSVNIATFWKQVLA
jgi:predicted RNA methylase